jgi:hypothetical protein
MKKLLLAIGILLGFVSAGITQEISFDDYPELENQANHLLSQKYTGYSVMKLKDMGKPLQEYFLKNYPKEYPGLILGNFRHPSVTDCAALLVDTKKPESGIKLFVLVLGLNTTKPEIRLIQDFRGEILAPEFYLLYESRRTIPDVENDNWVDMTSGGFSLNPFDKGGEKIYYWQDKILKTVSVTD